MPGQAYKRVGGAADGSATLNTSAQMSRAEYERLLRDRPGAEHDGQVVAQEVRPTTGVGWFPSTLRRDASCSLCLLDATQSQAEAEEEKAV